MTFTFQLIAAVVLFFFSIVSGVVLSKSGRPLKTSFFTVHKLLALACVIFSGLIFYEMYKSFPLNTTAIIFLSVMIISIIGIVVTGAVLSFEKTLPPVFLFLHKLFTVTALLSAALVKYFLAGII